MLYITGIQALNIEDSTECCGDWHTSAQDWSKLNIADSADSRFGDWVSNKIRLYLLTKSITMLLIPYEQL